MKKIEKIRQKIEAEKWLLKNIEKLSYYDIDTFIDHGFDYIKAIKECRMINSIGSVSSSGMSRTIKFMSCEKGKDKYYYRNYWAFFQALGYTKARSNDSYFSIGGCGMDMIFHTNYTNIHYLCRWGFITKQECDKLSQMTPSTI